jgi:hypothetical protein
MSQPTNTRTPETPDDPRQIGKLARAYAQSRVLGFVVFQLIFLLLFAAMSALPYLGAVAYRHGHSLVFYGCVTLDIIASMGCAFLGVYLSVPRWGGKFTERLIARLYAGEGTAQLIPPSTRGRKLAGGLLAAAFGTCIIASVALGFLYRIPDMYMQPISAIYTVPFLVGLWLLMRPAMPPMALLWPALYAIHAILIVVGAPIVFVGPWNSLNILIPMAGYGLVLGLIAHAYNRFALRKLRQTARGGLQNQTSEESQP